MVGATGFEPATSCSQSTHSTPELRPVGCGAQSAGFSTLPPRESRREARHSANDPHTLQRECAPRPVRRRMHARESCEKCDRTASRRHSSAIPRVPKPDPRVRHSGERSALSASNLDAHPYPHLHAWAVRAAGSRPGAHRVNEPPCTSFGGADWIGPTKTRPHGSDLLRRWSKEGDPNRAGANFEIR